MKIFHLYGSTEYQWTAKVEAETEDEAVERCRNMVFDGYASYHEQEIDILGCDLEDEVEEEI